MVRLGKLLFVTLLLLLSSDLLAPVNNSLSLFFTPPVEPFKKLIHAIGMVETKHDTLAFNRTEGAVGYFQIREIRLEDYNKRTGSSYKMTDLYDYHVSEKIFLYYASKTGPYDFETIARNWNGSGPKTHYYWNRVKKHL